jgi:hypothetical protein
MKRLLLVLVAVAALAGGALWLFPDLLDAARTAVVGVPPRGPGPGIAITCAGIADKGGFIGVARSERAVGGITQQKATMRFLAPKSNAVEACNQILEAAKNAKLRAMRERRTTVVIYGANLAPTNTSEIDLKVERF